MTGDLHLTKIPNVSATFIFYFRYLIVIQHKEVN